jgi:hypothetical protein
MQAGWAALIRIFALAGIFLPLSGAVLFIFSSVGQPMARLDLGLAGNLAAYFQGNEEHFIAGKSALGYMQNHLVHFIAWSMAWFWLFHFYPVGRKKLSMNRPIGLAVLFVVDALIGLLAVVVPGVVFPFAKLGSVVVLNSWLAVEFWLLSRAAAE